jgi:hypothetical protein
MEVKIMTGETLWNSIIDSLPSEGEEMQTKTGLWFRASSRDGRLYVEKATNHAPSSNLSMQRAISKKDFIFVHSYYERWICGETGVRFEVSKKSRNTAYIFALIERFINR